MAISEAVGQRAFAEAPPRGLATRLLEDERGLAMALLFPTVVLLALFIAYPRIGDEQRQQHDGRKQQRHRQPALVLKKARGQPARWRLRERSLTYGFAYRHCLFLCGPAPAPPSRLGKRAARLRRSEPR